MINTRMDGLTLVIPKSVVSGGLKVPQSATAKKEFAGALCGGILADAGTGPSHHDVKQGSVTSVVL
jgi:hypothetical protein